MSIFERCPQWEVSLYAFQYCLWFINFLQCEEISYLGHILCLVDGSGSLYSWKHWLPWRSRHITWHEVTWLIFKARLLLRMFPTLASRLQCHTCGRQGYQDLRWASLTIYMHKNETMNYTNPIVRYTIIAHTRVHIVYSLYRNNELYKRLLSDSYIIQWNLYIVTIGSHLTVPV